MIVLDGIGIGRRDAFDAVHLARTPVLDRLFESGAYRTLAAHGVAVGLPADRDLGGSEVGHNVMGAGRVIDQGPKLVDGAFADGSIWKGAWSEIVDRLKSNGGALHLVGLLSDGNIHSHVDHVYRIIEQAARSRLARLYLHVLLDGRDVPDRSGGEYVAALETRLATHCEAGRDYRIVSVGGRMVSIMDRYEADWGMVETGWNAMVHGRGRRFATALAGIDCYQGRDPELSDQYLPPFLVAATDRDLRQVEDGDAVILFNFRGDRAIELCRAFESGAEFDAFDRGRVPDAWFAGMMLYDGDLGVPNRYLVQPPRLRGCVSEYLAANGVTQFACAETQKYGHVTYFWNGNRSGAFDATLESYVEIPSDNVPFEQRPWMKAAQTADRLIETISGGAHRFIRANFAGGDMVGHSGRLEPTIVAVEAIDLSLGRVLKALEESRGCVVVTADHGNAEDMVERDRNGEPIVDDDGRPRRRTAHSLNPVPFCVKDYSGRDVALRTDLEQAGLANVGPTLLELLGFAPPAGYAPSLLRSG